MIPSYYCEARHCYYDELALYAALTFHQHMKYALDMGGKWYSHHLRDTAIDLHSCVHSVS